MNYHWIISLILIFFWSVNNNISQLSKIKNPELSISSFQPFLVKDFTTSSIVFGVPTKKGAFGMNFLTMETNIFKCTMWDLAIVKS